MLDDIKFGVFGYVQGFVFTIEFQKHGLPHMHLLLFLKQWFKICDAHHINSIVSAQIPDPVTHPALYATVTKCMTHGPCGPEFTNSPCMVKGKCSKHYPKDFCAETCLGQDGYLEYARPNDGRTYTNSCGHTFDNHDTTLIFLPGTTVTVMFVGDFRQTLPVIQRGSRVQIVNASLDKSRLWRHVHVLHLTHNMCLDCTPESDAFAQWLLTVGAGSPLPPDKSIQLPQNMLLPHNSINKLINSIYPGIDHEISQTSSSSSILSCLPRMTLLISSISSFLIGISHGCIQVGSQCPHYYIVPRFPGEQSIQKSVDKVNTDSAHTVAQKTVPMFGHFHNICL